MRKITPKFVKDRIKKMQCWKQIAYGSKISFLKSIHIKFDLFMSMLIIGNRIDEYFKYGFFEKTYKVRREFIVAKQRKIIDVKCNNQEKKVLFDDKIQFNRVFNDYLNRDWLDTSMCTYNQYLEFTEKHKDAFFKPILGSFGIGVGTLDTVEDGYSEEFFLELQKSGSILEEKIDQVDEMAKFNASSINTIRVVTLIDRRGITHIMAAVFRTGRLGKLADNFHHSGLAAKIDPATGIVVSDAIDNELKKYKEHPDSNLAIKGFCVPMWKEVLHTCVEASKVVPDIRYVGWDIAITDKGITIIEGNCMADPDIIQMPLDKGVWKEFVDLL